MPSPTGRRRPLPLPRVWVADLMRAARHVPYVGVELRMELGAVAAARAAAVDPPSWPALFLKGYATVAARTPPLRWTYRSFPWPHLYETDESVAAVAVARDYDGVPAVFPGMVRGPDRQPLRQLTAHLRDLKTTPVGQVRSFARVIRYSRYPLPVRRLLWWLGLNLAGRVRVRTFGSFGLTAVGHTGATVAQVTSLLPACLTYGPIGPNGSVTVGLYFDHRVMDGVTAAAALAELERELCGPLVAEMAGGGPNAGTEGGSSY